MCHLLALIRAYLPNNRTLNCATGNALEKRSATAQNNSITFDAHSIRTWALRCLLCSFCAILPKTGHAYTTELIQYLEKNDTHAAYQWLIENEPLYANDPAFNEWLAQLALLNKHYPQAINALERLILLRPNHIGARLDLTLSYYKTGAISEAREELDFLKEILIDVKNIPRDARVLLQEMNINLAHPTPAPKLAAKLQMTAGYDSNANLATDASSITLNLQGLIPIELNLAPESIASSDIFVEERLQISASEPSNTCSEQQWCYSMLGDFSVRHYEEQTTYNRQHLLVAGLASRQTEKSRQQWLTYIQYAEPNDQDVQSILAVEYSHQKIDSATLPSYTLHADYRNAQRNQTDTQYLAASLYTDSSKPWSQSVNVGYHLQPKRHAGDTIRIQLSSSYNTRLGPWLLRQNASAIYERDTDSYSEFLFGSTARQDTSLTFNTNIARMLNPHWSLSLNLRYSKTISSIPLFNHDRLEAYSTLSYSW